MTRFERWGRGVGIAIRIYGAGVIVAIALAPLHFIPEEAEWPIILLGFVYAVIVAPYAFYRGLRICGLAVRILNQGPVNSATKRKNEELRRENERQTARAR